MAFAFVGGYGDAAGYVLADTFTGHITGAIVLSAISVARRDWHSFLLRVSGIVCFLIGVFIAAILERHLAKRLSRQLLSVVIAMEIAFVALGYLAMRSRLQPVHELLVACLSLALGLQNGVWRRSGGVSVHTTYLTGMIINLVAAEAEKVPFAFTKARGTAVNSALGLSGGVWTAFLLGAIAGAASVLRYHAAGILGAALVLLIMWVSCVLAGPLSPPAEDHPIAQASGD
ncbi:MAG: YoaK family protein [Candidatus Acidiferrales bacterium]